MPDPENSERFLVVFRDITDQRERARLEKENERMYKCLDASQDLVQNFSVRQERIFIEHASSSHELVLGHEPRALLGEATKITQLYRDIERRGVLPALMRAFENGTMQSGFIIEFPLLHADGRLVWFEHKYTRNPSDPASGIIVSRDLSERRAAQSKEKKYSTSSWHLSAWPTWSWR